MLVLHGVAGIVDRDGLEEALASFQPIAAALAPGARLRTLEAGPLALIVTDAGAIAPELFLSALKDVETAQRLALAHSQLLNGLIGRFDLLPARLSGATQDEGALLAQAVERQELLLERLAYVEGAAEYALKISEPARAEKPAAPARKHVLRRSTGRAYLQKRLDRRRTKEVRREAIETLLDAALAAAKSVAREVRAQRGPTERRPNLLLDLAILAPKRAEADIAKLAQAAGPRAEALGLTSEATGPWAPFSFTESLQEAEDAQAAAMVDLTPKSRERAS